MMKNLLITMMIILAGNNFASEGTGLGGTQLKIDGTGIGGANISTDKIGSNQWCDDAMTVLFKYQRKGANAQADGESILALTNYYKGLQIALQTILSQNMGSNSSLTFRAIERSLVLAEIMGVVDVIANNTYAQSISADELENLILLMKWNYDFITEVSNDLDQVFMKQYLVLNSQCVNCTEVERNNSIRMLDTKLVKFAKKQVQDYVDHFFNIKISAAVDNYNTADVLNGLKNVLVYSSMDLNMNNMFGAALSCQSRKLFDLSEEIGEYLTVRRDAKKDQQKITVFLLGIDSVLREIDQQCGDL